MYLSILLFGISGGEILILLLLVLLLFGPKRIPEIARMIGKGMGEVKKVQREINSEIYRYSSEIERSTKEMDAGGDNHKQDDRSAAGRASSVRDVETPSDAGKAAGGPPDESTGKKKVEDTTLGEQDDDDAIPYPYRKPKDTDSIE